MWNNIHCIHACISYLYFELKYRCDTLIQYAFANVIYPSRIDVLRSLILILSASVSTIDHSCKRKKKERKVKAFVSVSARWRRKHFHRQDIQVGLWRGNGYMQAPVIGWARGWGAWTWLMRRCVLDVIRSPKEFLRMPGLRSKVEFTAKDG